MTNKLIIRITLIGVLVLAMVGISLPPGRAELNAAPETASVSTAFTYQGRLTEGDNPADDLYDFEFKLYDAVNGGTQVSSTVTGEDVAVSGGLFTVEIDFGSVYDGAALWLEIAVRLGSSTGSYTTLSPRQSLTATPYAQYSQNTPWDGISNVPPDLADGDDDTTYSAGLGLALNGTLFSVDTNTIQARINQNCAVGQAIRVIQPNGNVLCNTTTNWSSLAGIPADLADGDDNTTYSAGSGLTLNGTQFSVNTSTIQARVSGNCAVGQAIQAILADGAVVCQPTANPALTARQAFSHNIVDQSGDVGNYPSITIGVDGMPIFSHYASDDHDLKVSHCNDPACNSATWTLVDTNGGEYSAITIGVDGLPLISYVHNSNALKVAHCHDLYCNSADIATVDATGSMGHSAITIGADGLGLISYQDAQNGLLKVAHCEQLDCSTQTVSTLASSLGIGSDYNSIVLGSDGLGLILYNQPSTDRLHLAHCNDLICSAATVISATDGFSSSLAIGADGLAVFSYVLDSLGSYSLYVGRCNNVTCTSYGFILILPQFALAGPPIRTSIAIGSDGIPLITYDSSTIHILRCTTVDCQGGFSLITLSIDGKQPAMVIGADNLPNIAFQDGAQERLEVVRTVLGRGTPYR